MKKALILLTILFIVFIRTDIHAYKAEKIDLQIKENEISVVFLRLKNSKSLLIKDENSNNLFVLEYKNDTNLKETLKIFGKTPDIYFLKNKIDRKIDNTYIIKNKHLYRFQINNYNLCIYDNSKGNIKTCDFIYLMNLKQKFTPSEKNSVIFYDENIENKYLKNVQESWIDNNIVSTESFTILKINEESYNVVIVPLAKY